MRIFMMPKYRSLQTGLWLLWAGCLLAESLSLPAFFDLVRLKHPAIQSERIQPEIAALEGQIARTAQLWAARSASSYLYSEPVEPSAFTPGEIREASFSAGTEKSIWSTGGRLSINYTANWTKQDLPDISIPTPLGDVSSFSIGLNRFYKNQIQLNYSQPLWQNYGGSLDRLEYELNRFYVGAAEYQSVENQEKFMLRMGNLYLDWVLLSEKHNILKERLSLSEEQADYVKQKSDVFLVEHIDVLRAEDAVRMARQNLLLVESQRNAVQTELAVLAKTPKIESMQPDYPLYQTDSLPASDQVFEEARDQIRILKVLQQQKSRLERMKQGFKEQKDPRLNLNVGAGYAAGNERLNEAFGLNRPHFQASLQFSYPLGTDAASIHVQKTQLEIRQSDLQHENTLLDIRSGLSALLIRIREMKHILKLNEQHVASAMKRMEEEQKLYRQGRGQLNFVIQSRDTVQNAKLIYAKNAAGYQKLLLQYRELTDTLLKETDQIE